MKKFPVLMTAVAAAAFLAGCGGSSPGDQSPRLPFTRIVSFGDSLSDVGTYRTTLIAQQGDGLYSINGDFSKEGLPYTNWTQYLASTLQVSQPCAAEVGLTPPPPNAGTQDINPLLGLTQAPAAVSGCFNYAEGGARVTDPVGPGNAALYTQFGSSSGFLGQLTYPLVQQVANFGTNGNTFSDTDLVTVLAGGNDLFINRDLILAGAIGQILATVPADQQAAAIAQQETNVIGLMSAAGTELAALVKTQMVAAGATHVVVVNLPDVSLTPDAAHYKTTQLGQLGESIHPNLTLDMVTAFNTALQTGLFGDGGDVTANPNIVWVDAFSQSDAQLLSPATYGLTNLTTPACDLTKTGVTAPGAGFIPLPTSLFCTKGTLIPPPTDTTTDADPTGVMNYLYADMVHPTPFGYRLLAEYVGLQMSIKGWL